MDELCENYVKCFGNIENGLTIIKIKGVKGMTKGENKMLIRKLHGSSKTLQLYPLNGHKGIALKLGEDGRVDKLAFVEDGKIVAEYKATAIVFPACFTVKDDRYLSTELLTDWEDAFEAVYEA